MNLIKYFTQNTKVGKKARIFVSFAQFVKSINLPICFDQCKGCSGLTRKQHYPGRRLMEEFHQHSKDQYSLHSSI